MNRRRWTALAVVVAVLAVSGVAYGVTAGDRGTPAASSATTSTTARPTTTTTEATTTTTTPTTVVPPTTLPPADAVLVSGDRGPEVEALQRRLAELRFDPGPVDGAFGPATVYAVQGFQKLNGMGPDGKVGPEVLAALENPAPVTPLVPGGDADRVEVDLVRQLLFLYDGGELRLVTHVSTGNNERYCVKGDCNTAVTPVGAFRFSWRYPGWRQSRLGKLYNPVYFTGSGIAVHGATSVPTHPASHGCVRIPMHIAEYFPSLVDRGDAVYVTDGRPVGPATMPSGPPPADPPSAPEPTTTTTTVPPTTTPPTTTPTTTSTTSTTAPPSTTTTSPPTTSTTSTTVSLLP